MSPAPTKRPRKVVEAEFEHMQRQAKLHGWEVNCDGRPEEFCDYEGERPTARRAQELCAGCPLINLCLEFATVTKIAWGVYGGVVWEHGKQVPAVDHALAEAA